MSTKNNFFCCILRTGGTDGSLDDIDGTGLADGDVALVAEDGESYLYRLDADSALTEDDPKIISPDSNAGNKRWILQNEVIQQYHPYRKNLIINGAMRVAQRGTTFTTINSSQYTLDRWRYVDSGTTAAAVTITKDTEVPSGEGFGNSLKIDCTTAESGDDADEIIQIATKIEAQDLIHLRYGTSDAKTITLSFWLKSDTKTGTFSTMVYGNDSDYSYVTEHTVADNNWKRYTVTIPGDTSNAITNDTGIGFYIGITLVCGSTYDTSSTDQWISGDYYAGENQDNFLDSTDNNIYITGAQLEVGEGASDFEFRPYSEELQRCMRYYEQWDYDDGSVEAVNAGPIYSATNYRAPVWYMVPKLKAPTITFTGTGTLYYSGSNYTPDSVSATDINTLSFMTSVTKSGESWVQGESNPEPQS